MRRVRMTIGNETSVMRVIANVLNELKGRQYRFKFRREATCLYCFELREWIMPDDFTVDELYHFEEISSPDEERMLYAISLSRGVKGFLVETCCVYMDNISHEMIMKLQPNHVSTPGNDSASHLFEISFF